MCEACPEMVNHNEPHMEVCATHLRWTLINRADGTMARRDCPECPKGAKRQFLNLRTGQILTPVIVREPDDRLTFNG